MGFPAHSADRSRRRRFLFALPTVAVFLGAGFLIRNVLDPGTPATETPGDSIDTADDGRTVIASDLETVEQDEHVGRTSAPPEPPVKIETLDSPSTGTGAPGFTLEGTVVDDLGAPVPTFSIRASRLSDRRPPALDPDGDVWRLFQGTNGSFRLENLVAAEWELFARRPASVRSCAVVASVPAPRRIVLVLPRPAAIAGIVEDSSGNPIPKASIYVWNADEPGPSFMSNGSSTDVDAHTDASGRFRVEDVQPGSPRLLARHPDFGDGEWMTFELDPGQDKGDVRFVLTRGGRVEGLLDASVAPIDHRRVALMSLRGTLGWRDARSDDSGRFVFEGVLPQNYVIQLHAPDNRGSEDPRNIRKRITVREGETTRIDFSEADRSLVIRGRVTASGRPLPGSMVVVSRNESGLIDRPARTDSDGRFSLAVEGPGNYRFRIGTNFGSYAWFERDVPDAREAEEVFELAPGRITGRVVGSDGHGLAHIPLTVLRSGGTDDDKPWLAMRFTFTESDGSFEFAFLSDGAYTLRAPDGGEPLTPIPYGRVLVEGLSVQAGDPSPPLEIRLAPEGWISGQVMNSKGLGLANVTIQVRTKGGVTLSAFSSLRTDATGYFLVSNVAAGTYVVVAKRSGVEAESPLVDVVSGRTATARIEMR